MTAFMNMDYGAVFETQQQIIQYECDEEGEGQTGGWGGCGVGWGVADCVILMTSAAGSRPILSGDRAIIRHPPHSNLPAPSPPSKTDAFFCRFCLLEYRGKFVQITSLPRIVTLMQGLRV